MEDKNKGRKTSPKNSKPASNKRRESEGVEVIEEEIKIEENVEKIDVEIHHVFRCRADKAQYIRRSLEEWSKQWL